MAEYGWAIGIGIIILAVSAARTLRVVGRVLANRAARGGTSGNAGGPELRPELDDLRRRLEELEERVDFTERLLAKQREADRLARPQ